MTNVVSGGTSFAWARSPTRASRFATAAFAAALIALQSDPVVRSRSAIGSLVAVMVAEEVETASTLRDGWTSRQAIRRDAGIFSGQARGITRLPSSLDLPEGYAAPTISRRPTSKRSRARRWPWAR